MPHFSYRKTAERLAKSNWGGNFADEKAAEEKLLEGVDLTGACLLALMNRLDRIVKAIYDEQTNREKNSIRDEVWHQFNDFISNKETKHGPCPMIVSKALHHSTRLEMSDNYFHGYDHISCTITLPEKGTKARSEYNKWMKRKARQPKLP